MFNIGPLEVLTVLIIALVVVGPKRLPELARTIGRGLNEFRKIQDEVKDMVKFDLGADLTDDAEEPAHHPVDEPAEVGEFDGQADDGMTHSERVIASLPDDDEATDDEELAPLPSVASGTVRNLEPEEPVEAGDAVDPSEPPAEQPPAAAAE